MQNAITEAMLELSRQVNPSERDRPYTPLLTGRVERKVACDRLLPACTTCVNRGENCGGYGTKLSWPIENDRRRAMVSEQHTLFPAAGKQLHFITTGHWDMELSQRLADASPDGWLNFHHSGALAN